MWTQEYSVEASASPSSVWKLLSDVTTWSAWNAGVESIELTGAFATGSVFKMKVPGAPDAFTSRLIDVRMNGGFTDETVVGDTVVLVHHRLAALPSGGTKITYRAEVSGPDADELGPQISADFPQVLAALKVVTETDF
jgi:Polyketide cyclase / dehydrase and lipid transport